MGSIYRDEARYLREWLCYHLLVGVEHFFLLSHDMPGSEEDLAAQTILGPFLAKGLVTTDYITDRTPDCQLVAWSQLLAQWGAQCKWICLTDADSFLYPGLGDRVAEILPSYELPTVAGLAV